MPQVDGESGVRLARVLFPDLAAELDDALARHGGGEDRSFDEWLDERTAAVRAGLGGVSFGSVEEPGSRERLERAFAAARTVAGWAHLSVPEPEAFAESGVDFARLGAALAADPTLAPVVAPYGLGAAGWRKLFARAAQEDRSPLAAVGGVPVAGMADSGAEDSGAAGAEPLVLASEAEREFGLLDAVPNVSVPVLPGPGASAEAVLTRAPTRVTVPSGSAHRPVRWTLRLIPAGLAPAVLGLSFEHGPHASLPEMLMLQLTRVVTGEPLVDARSFTWLAGPLADGRLAARHVYDAAERAVRINCREIGNQGPHLGARPPVA